MSSNIGHLHHVGLVVNDMEAALELYRRLGFTLTPPSYPVLSPGEGAPPEPLGAANTHADFSRNFVEIVTVAGKGKPVPEGADLVPLEVPPTALPRFHDEIDRTVAGLASRLSRFQGLHILVFQTRDVGAFAEHLDELRIDHGDPGFVERPVDAEDGKQMVPVRYLEINDEAANEGRLAVAENPPAELLRTQGVTDHPNGAVDLVESVLCVAERELDDFERRYEGYLGRHARGGDGTRTFDLEGSSVVLVADTALKGVLPDERPPALPAFVAYGVTVPSVASTREFLEGNGFPVLDLPDGDFFVPAAAALGAAVVFRQAG
jgi:catechol 2,3-dioxygenase-like lactoylglutathione lyase family enzyme